MPGFKTSNAGVTAFMPSSSMGTGDPNAVLILSQQVLPTEAPKSTVKTPECFQSPTSDIAGQYHVWIQVICVEICFLSFFYFYVFYATCIQMPWETRSQSPGAGVIEGCDVCVADDHGRACLMIMSERGTKIIAVQQICPTQQDHIKGSRQPLPWSLQFASASIKRILKPFWKTKAMTPECSLHICSYG